MNVTVYGVFEDVKYLCLIWLHHRSATILYLKVIAFKNNGKSYAFFSNVVKMATDIFDVLFQGRRRHYFEE